jgi:maltose/moltooligosaccharide transporter
MTTSAATLTAKPRLSGLQIWNMCFGFFGIQIGFGLQNANTSRIFQTLGASVDNLPILWIAAPATGLLVQPIIGYLSDKTWGPLGRRRPYFFYGALLTTLALLVMPNSPALWVAAGMLWVMDASINITMEPFRAFVGDQLPDDQRTAGYATQSLFIGAGAVFASALPWMLSHWFGVANTAAAGQVPDSVRIAFYVGAAGLLLAVMWTVFTTREYPPDQLEAFNKKETGAPFSREGRVRSAGAYYGGGLIWLAIGAGLIGAIYAFKYEKELYVLGALIAGFGVAQIIAGALAAQGKINNGFSEVIEDLFAMPVTMRQLALVQFFSWFGLFAMWIYTTAGVAAYHYHNSDPTSAAYNEGADWVGVLFAVYNGVAVFAAMLIPPLANVTNRRLAHALNLCLGAAGMASFFFIRDPHFLWLSMIGVGFAWASILSVPYSILSGALPFQKMGVYMGIFNFFIVIPQLMAATVLGLLLRTFFHGEAIYALALGAGSLVLAALSTFAVKDETEIKRAKAA